MAQVVCKSRLKRNGPRCSIALGEEFQVGNIAAPEPPVAERRREWLSAEVQPAIGVDPPPVPPSSDWLAAVAENTPHGGQSGRTGPRADSNSDGRKSPKLRQVPIDHSRRKRRNGTGAANDCHPGRRSKRAECADAGDELAPVRQVDVVTPCVDCCARYRVVLSLERPCLQDFP